MKKPLILSILAISSLGLTQAATVPQNIVDRIEDIVIQFTKTDYSGEDILNKIEPIFEKCAESASSENTREMCASYLTDHFPTLEKKRKDVLPGGMSITSLGKLTKAERLELMGGDSISAEDDDDDTRYIYHMVQYPEYNLSFLVPQLAQEHITHTFNNTTYDALHKTMDRMLEENKPHYTPQELEDKITELNHRKCYEDIEFGVYDENISYHEKSKQTHARLWHKEISMSMVGDELGNRNKISVDIHSIPTDQTVESAILSPYEDDIGLTHTRKISPATTINGKIRGVGSNIQTMIDNGIAKVWTSNQGEISERLLLRMEQTPDVFYEINLMHKHPSILGNIHIYVDYIQK